MEIPSATDILKMISQSTFIPDSKPQEWRGDIDNDDTFDRQEAEEYVKKKELEKTVPNPEVAYLDKTIFPLLKSALIEMLVKVKEDNSFTYFNGTLNGLDHLSEVLYNRNPNHPERESNWTYIFDMPWVQNFLNENPRPHYPFHLIWTREFAALKIQSFMRGHWVRCRPDVQDLRLFWKVTNVLHGY